MSYESDIAYYQKLIGRNQDDIAHINAILPKLKKYRAEIITCKNFHVRTLEKQSYWKGELYNNYAAYHHRITQLADKQVAKIDNLVDRSEYWITWLEDDIDDLESEIQVLRYKIRHRNDD